MSDLATERLREVLSYEPEDGIFRWRASPSRRVKAGKVAGCVNKTTGYRYIRIDGKDRLEHRLAWQYVHGTLPDGVIDHINCQRADNRIANLRDTTNAINMQNRSGANKGNACGLLGVAKVKSIRNPWRAQLDVGGKRLNLGSYATPELAHAAYMAAKAIHHPGFVNNGDAA